MYCKISVYRSQTYIESRLILCRREGRKYALEPYFHYGHSLGWSRWTSLLRRRQDLEFGLTAEDSLGRSCLECQHFRCDRVLRVSVVSSRWPLRQTYEPGAVHNNIHRYERQGRQHVLLCGNGCRRQFSGEQLLERSGGNSPVSVGVKIRNTCYRDWKRVAFFNRVAVMCTIVPFASVHLPFRHLTTMLCRIHNSPNCAVRRRSLLTIKKLHHQCSDSTRLQ